MKKSALSDLTMDETQGLSKDGKTKVEFVRRLASIKDKKKVKESLSS